MKHAVISNLFHTFALAFKKQGWLPEWPNGADCKSAGDAFGGSNPSPPTTNIKVCHLHGAPFFRIDTFVHHFLKTKNKVL